MPYLNPADLLTEDFVREEFGVTCEGIPVTGVRMVDGQAVKLYRESDVIRPEAIYS